MATTTSGENSLASSPHSLCAQRTKMTNSATSPSSRLNCGPYLMIIFMAPSKVAYLHCTRIQQGQAGVSAITRRPNAFIVAHELGWASTRSRPGPPFCSIRNNSIVKSLQRGIQTSVSGCSSSALIADMKLNLKKTLSTRWWW